MDIKLVPIGNIKKYEKNAKKHPEEQIQAIAHSIKEFGFKQPLVLDSNNVIIIGHGRYEAARALNLAELPCLYADDLNREQIKALRLADNKVAESDWDEDLLKAEILDIDDIDMSMFNFDIDSLMDENLDDPIGVEDDRDPSCQHNVFENQEVMQFPCNLKWGIPEMQPTQTVGDKMLRFMDWKEIDNPEDYIAHFYYDDYKFMAAWRDPNKYIDRLLDFKAVVSPDFSLYIDFPLALQILSCYRRQWCGAYWQSLGIDVIPDVVWGEKASFEFCFEGIPKKSTVAVSTVGVKNDKEWNNGIGTLFKDGYDEMLNRLEPTTVIFYGDMIDGLQGNIIRIPSYYEERRKILNARPKKDELGDE